MITDREIALANNVARKAASKWSLVEAEDLASTLCLWMVEHASTVARYRTADGGDAHLFVALRRVATRYCVREQAARSGGPLIDDAQYTVDQVERALPFVFEDVPQSEYAEVGGAAIGYRGTHSEALAIVTDLRGAVQDMPEEVRETIYLRFRDGLSYTDMGRLTGISGEAAKKRVTRAVRRVRDRLVEGDV